MNVIRATILGFCMGVKRAVDLARTEAECSAGRARTVYTLGSLIHNPQVLDDLRRRGVAVLDGCNLPRSLHDASVIIRAHGISLLAEAELRGRGGRIVDATCPRVKTSQLKAAAFAEAGYRLFLAGEEHHAEMVGIRGYAEVGAAVSACVVVGNAAEAEQAAARLYAEDSGAKTALIGQTTISPEEYQSIGGVIIRFFPNLEITQTICPATRERQDSLRELLDKVDAVIVAGGKDSANTRRLLTIAETAAKPCVIVEAAADIPPDFFRFNTIGLAAGASTPDVIIDTIEQTLQDPRRRGPVPHS